MKLQKYLIIIIILGFSMETNAYDHLFQKYGKEKGIDWLLLKAQVKQESRFKADSVSPVGAVGLAQFMRATWEEWKDGTPGIQSVQILLDRKNPEHSIRAQAAYLRWILNQVNKYPVNEEDAIKISLACYNYGTRPIKWLKQGQTYGEFWHKLPNETKVYIAKIMKYYTEYKTKK